MHSTANIHVASGVQIADATQDAFRIFQLASLLRESEVPRSSMSAGLSTARRAPSTDAVDVDGHSRHDQLVLEVTA